MNPDPPSEAIRQRTASNSSSLATARRKGKLLDVLQVVDSDLPEAVVWESQTGEVLLQGAKSGHPVRLCWWTFMAHSRDAAADWIPLWQSLASIAETPDGRIQFT